MSRLIALVQQQSNRGQFEFEELESITSLIIAHDDFDSLPNNIQDAVYFIDMHEIEKPSIEQIMAAANVLKEFTDTSDE